MVSLLKRVLFVIALATAAGVTYEQLGQRRDLNGIRRIGRSVDIGGRTLNINCAGQEGQQVVLDSGTNNPGYAWVLVQPFPKAMAAEGSSGLTQDQSAEQVRASQGLGNRPLIVLTAGKPEFSASDPGKAQQAMADQSIWIHELQAQLVKLSPRGRQLVVENSTHGIPWEAPDVVAESIRELVTIVRRESPSSLARAPLNQELSLPVHAPARF